MDEFADLLDAVMTLDVGERELDIVAALASERAKNIRLKDEQAWLKERIAQEDARLTNG